MLIPIKDINADQGFNCRGKILPIDVADLAKDIDREGLLQPVIIMEYDEPVDGKKYHLVAGFRRFTAHLVLKKTEIECLNKGPYNDEEARFINLNENIQRRDLSFMQEALAVKKVMQTMLGNKATERGAENKIMEKLGASRGWVQVRLMAVKLPEDIQDELLKGNFASQQDVRDLYSVHITGNREALVDMVKNIKDLKYRKPNFKSPKKPKLKKTSKRLRNRREIFEIQNHLREFFGNDIKTRLLAWCAGEITTGELSEDLVNLAQNNSIPYIPLEME